LRHEFSKVCAVPSTLRLVKNRNPLNRRIGDPKIGITKVYNILDEAFYFSLSVGLADFLTAISLTVVFIASQCLTQHFDEWSVTRQEHRVLLSVHVCTLGNEVQSGQGLTGAGHPGHKANGLVLPCCGLINDLGDTIGVFLRLIAPASDLVTSSTR
jgi:hypothetical protein